MECYELNTAHHPAEQGACLICRPPMYALFPTLTPKYLSMRSENSRALLRVSCRSLVGVVVSDKDIQLINI